MAKKTIVYKGYRGSMEVNTEDYSLFGKVLFIDEEMHYKGENFEELERNFQEQVEKHIALCIERGEGPAFWE